MSRKPRPKQMTNDVDFLVTAPLVTVVVELWKLESYSSFMPNKTEQLSSCSTLVACNWQWFRAPLLGVFLHFSVISFLSLFLPLSPAIPLISHSCQEWWLLSAGRPFCKCCKSSWSGSSASGAAEEEAKKGKRRWWEERATRRQEWEREKARVQCGDRERERGREGKQGMMHKPEKRRERMEEWRRCGCHNAAWSKASKVPFKRLTYARRQNPDILWNLATQINSVTLKSWFTVWQNQLWYIFEEYKFQHVWSNLYLKV